MLGTTVNAIAIIICASLGAFLIKNVPERFDESIKKALGLGTMYIGIKGALESQMILLLIMSMIAGTIIGEFINIEGAMNRLGKFIETKLKFGEGSFSKGFVAASILFCTGSMAIVGSFESGLSGNHEILFTKSILDGTISIVFASSMGIGVAFSAIPVFIYQGAITLGAGFIKDFLTPDIIREMSATGSLIIAGIGLNFFGVQPIRVANMIPAMFIPWIYLGIVALFV